MSATISATEGVSLGEAAARNANPPVALDRSIVSWSTPGVPISISTRARGLSGDPPRGVSAITGTSLAHRGQCAP